MTSSECREQLKRARIVAVIRAETSAQALRAARLLYEGGVRALEITTTVPDYLDVISMLAGKFDGASVGAGTVLSSAGAAACLEAGAQFVVAPNTNPEVISMCRDADVLCAPGALTPSEIVFAASLGAPIVKVFPCDALGGPAYVRALKGPLPGVELMPTGGVRADNVEEFLRAGAACVGVGGNLVDLDLMHRDEAAFVMQVRLFTATT